MAAVPAANLFCMFVSGYSGYEKKFIWLDSEQMC